MNTTRARRWLRATAAVVAFASSPLVPAESAAGSAATTLAGKQAPLAREYAQAEQAFQAGDLNTAQERYSKILHTHGDQPLAWFRLGVIYQRQQDPRAALRAYESAVASADHAAASDETRKVLGKARFNRALLLLQGASEDLGRVPAGLLDKDLDASRKIITAHVDAALLAVGNQPLRERASPARDSDVASARGYLYTVPEPKVIITTNGGGMPIRERSDIPIRFIPGRPIPGVMVQTH